MDKLSTQSKGIVLQGKHSLQATTEYDRKVDLITSYMEKYAMIANRALTTPIYAMYCEILEEYPEDRIKKGLEMYLRTGTAFPWPEQLVECIEAAI